MKAQYHNKLTNETYSIGSEKPMTIERAWSLFDWVCSRNGWNNEDVEHITVKVS